VVEVPDGGEEEERHVDTGECGGDGGAYHSVARHRKEAEVMREEEEPVESSVDDVGRDRSYRDSTDMVEGLQVAAKREGQDQRQACRVLRTRRKVTA
jgi:hypothetical protein